MVQYKRSGVEDARDEHAGSPEAERRAWLAQLVATHTKLSASEAVMLREVFPEILAAHEDQVWSRLRRRGLEGGEAEDLFQDVFLALYHWLLEHGFPDSVGGILKVLTEGLLLNHLRAKRRAPESVALPSSGSEKPPSGPDVDRVIDLREMAQRLIPELPPEQQEVVGMVILGELSMRDAAMLLGVPEGTVKSRLMAAKRGLVTLAERLLPPSERGVR